MLEPNTIYFVNTGFLGCNFIRVKFVGSELNSIGSYFPNLSEPMIYVGPEKLTYLTSESVMTRKSEGINLYQALQTKKVSWQGYLFLNLSGELLWLDVAMLTRIKAIKAN